MNFSHSVHNLHGLPGLLGSLLSIIIVGIANSHSYEYFSEDTPAEAERLTST